jgi:hypothetical protein
VFSLKEILARCATICAERLDRLAARRVAARVDDAVFPVTPSRVIMRSPNSLRSNGTPSETMAADVVGPLGDQHADGVRVAQAGARDQRVLLMENRRVVARDGGGDAALREPGIRDIDLVLGEYEARVPPSILSAV